MGDGQWGQSIPVDQDEGNGEATVFVFLLCTH